MNTATPAAPAIAPVLQALLGHSASADVVRMRPADRIAAVEAVWSACVRVGTAALLARAGELLPRA